MTKHTLKEYVDLLKNEGLYAGDTLSEETETTEIDCLTYDTRTLSGKALFVVKGAHFKSEYLSYALKNGACAYVCQEDSGFVFENAIYVSDVRRCLAPLALLFYGEEYKRLDVTGITGTKGKSTTLYFFKEILDLFLESRDEPSCAFISSIDTYDGKDRFESHITTPDVFELHRHIRNAVESGITALVTEVSSQALKYGRTAGIVFDVGVFTNIGTDHISDVEHRNFEDYFSSKLKIFDQCKTAVINADSENIDRIMNAAEGKCRIVTYGTKEGCTVRGSNIYKNDDAIFFTVETPDYKKEMSITMPGMFNVSNALCAAAIAFCYGIDPEFVEKGLKYARASGRMQVYKNRTGDVVVIVDYAHNKMSFEALYDSVRVEYPGYKIVSVFGCPGKKAFGRRADLGEAANGNADFAVICEEDSGEEAFESIAGDIKTKITDIPCFVEEDREKALGIAINKTGEGKKVILFTGKGEETRLKRGTEYVECRTDAELAVEALEEYDKVAR